VRQSLSQHDNSSYCTCGEAKAPIPQPQCTTESCVSNTHLGLASPSKKKHHLSPQSGPRCIIDTIWTRGAFRLKYTIAPTPPRFAGRPAVEANCIENVFCTAGPPMTRPSTGFCGCTDMLSLQTCLWGPIPDNQNMRLELQGPELSLGNRSRI